MAKRTEGNLGAAITGFDVSSAMRAVAEARGALDPLEVKRALASALNRTATKARTATSVYIRKEYAVKAADVKRTISIGKANAQLLESHVQSEGKPMKVSAFVTSQTAKGVTVRIKKAGKRKLIKSAFKLTGKVRARGEYVGGVFKPSDEREPAHSLLTLAIPTAMASDFVTDRLKALAEDFLPKRFAHELDFRIARAAGRLAQR